MHIAAKAVLGSLFGISLWIVQTQPSSAQHPIQVVNPSFRAGGWAFNLIAGSGGRLVCRMQSTNGSRSIWISVIQGQQPIEFTLRRTDEDYRPNKEMHIDFTIDEIYNSRMFVTNVMSDGKGMRFNVGFEDLSTFMPYLRRGREILLGVDRDSRWQFSLVGFPEVLQRLENCGSMIR
jgi:hypothetical protein